MVNPFDEYQKLIDEACELKELRELYENEAIKMEFS